MPTTLQALVVAVLAVLPGALYIWAFERQVGKWGVSLSDRVLRFVGVSSVLQALFLPATRWAWQGSLADMRELPLVSVWIASLAYVGTPLVLGTVVGTGVNRRWRIANWLAGPDQAPRSWDYLFQGRRDGWIRLKLKSGVWLGGGFANSEGGLRSYASGYPATQELFLSTVVDTDPDTGEFRFNGSGEPVLMDGGILVQWADVEYLEFIEAEVRSHGE